MKFGYLPKPPAASRPTDVQADAPGHLSQPSAVDWDAIKVETDRLWSSVRVTDVGEHLRLQKLALEIEVGERDANDPDLHATDREIRELKVALKRLKLLERLQRHDGSDVEDYVGPAEGSPESIAARRLARRGCL